MNFLKLILQSFLIVFLISCNTEKDNSRYIIKPLLAENAIPFNLNQVELLESPFKNAQKLDGEWLLSIEPDRLLHRFHKNAGFTPKAPLYGGWESLGVGGQSLGHYLSACAMMYSATGNEEFLKRVDYTVYELAKCQKARGTGYVGSIENEDRIWLEVAAGDIYSDGFDLNGGWVPWYVLHKLWAGLIDAYLETGNIQAKEIVVKLSDWAYDKFNELTYDQWQRVLACEHGGMLESLANVYALTGDKKYLEMSHWFNHEQLFSPWLNEQDSLAGLHANTQVPKAVGLARRHMLSGNSDDFTMSHFFWNTVTSHHSYSIGGNSDGEHFGEPGQLSTRLGDRTTETCNTYNMLKLTKLLFQKSGDPSYVDFYEKALYNHILSSQNPETGMVTYYVPLGSGSRREYSSPFETFTCCVGTGFENHARYGEAIYFKSKDHGIYVNLYIPSKLNWVENGVTITQQHEYPENGSISLTINSSQSNKFPVYLRYPSWATLGAALSVNGESIVINELPGSYIKIERKWEGEDKIELQIQMPLYLDPMPDNPQRAAIKYGPLVLAGQLGKDRLDPKDIPVLITNNEPINNWMIPDSLENATFKTQQVGLPNDVVLAPFYKVYDERYIVYFDHFTDETWASKEASYKAYLEEKERLKKQTIDFIQLGEMQPERDHNVRGDATHVGEFLGRKSRLAWSNGWFSFDMKLNPSVPMQLVCTYWGDDDSSNAFDILMNDEKIASVIMDAPKPDEFYDLKFDIPESITKNEKATFTFKSHKDRMVGRLFECRIIEKSK